jgi:hypothetical protein
MQLRVKYKKKTDKYVYTRLMLNIRVTGGYTGKAKSCIGAWVPAVSIHRPLSFYDFLEKQKFFFNIISKYILGKKRGHRAGREGERGGEGEPKGGRGPEEGWAAMGRPSFTWL